MNVTEAAIAAAITVSLPLSAYGAMNPAALIHRAEATADRASCAAVDLAIVAYVAEQDRQPRALDDIRPYVRGDVSTYRIDQGRAAGPGCEVRRAP